jgi:S1-C subfamily serine protease
MLPRLSLPSLAIALVAATVSVQGQGTAPTPKPSASATRPHGVSVSCSGCSFAPFEATFTTPPTVTEIEKGSPADKAGLRVDDRILAIGDHAITTPEGGAAYVRAIGATPQRWLIERGGTRITLTLKHE